MTYQEFALQWHSDSPAIKATTSGSTGTPSEIMLPKEMMRRSAARTIAFFNLSAESFLYSCISPDFIGGKMIFVRAEECGCRFGYESPTNTPFASADIDRPITLAAVVPSQMRHILDNPATAPEVETYLIGGSAISPELRKRIADAGINAYESYGMTETSSHIALRKVAETEPPFQTLDGIFLGSDNRGCLTIDMGPDGSIATNDLVDFTDDTLRHFRILGRADQVIITGGKKVNPLQLEQKISPLLPGKEICVTSRPDPLWTSRIVLLIETPEAADIPSDLHDKLRAILPGHECPKEILPIPSLPRTSSGKIKRLPLPPISDEPSR